MRSIDEKLADDKGFSLLEVVVALAIFSATVGILYPMFGVASLRVDATGQRAYGAAIAVSKMEEQLVLADWQALPKQGVVNDWNWEIEGSKYDHDTDRADDEDFLYKIVVTVTPANRRIGAPVRLQRIIYRRS